MDVKTSAQSKSSKISLDTTGVTFQYNAPKARTVSVAGSFNKWNTSSLPLTKDYQGSWKGSLNLKAGRYQYRFFVDGQWIDDPNAKETVPNGYGAQNAVLVVKG